MNRPRSIRRLRVAVTAVCLVMCASLIVLWTTSRQDNPNFPTPHGFGNFAIYSTQGLLMAVQAHTVESDTSRRFQLTPDGMILPIRTWSGFYAKAWNRSTWLIQVPYWFLTTIAGAFAAGPWIRWSCRFSLRTLLIVTTLVAMVLGFVVWTVR